MLCIPAVQRCSILAVPSITIASNISNRQRQHTQCTRRQACQQASCEHYCVGDRTQSCSMLDRIQDRPGPATIQQHAFPKFKKVASPTFSHTILCTSSTARHDHASHENSFQWYGRECGTRSLNISLYLTTESSLKRLIADLGSTGFDQNLCCRPPSTQKLCLEVLALQQKKTLTIPLGSVIIHVHKQSAAVGEPALWRPNLMEVINAIDQSPYSPTATVYVVLLQCCMCRWFLPWKMRVGRAFRRVKLEGNLKLRVFIDRQCWYSS